MTTNQQAREAFEAWHKLNHWEITRPEHYSDFGVKARWKCYQAARTFTQEDVERVAIALTPIMQGLIESCCKNTAFKHSYSDAAKAALEAVGAVRG